MPRRLEDGAAGLARSPRVIEHAPERGLVKLSQKLLVHEQSGSQEERLRDPADAALEVQAAVAVLDDQVADILRGLHSIPPGEGRVPDAAAWPCVQLVRHG